MKKLKLFVCLFFIFIPSFALSQSGQVIKVKDGDTIDILSNDNFLCRELETKELLIKEVRV